MTSKLLCYAVGSALGLSVAGLATAAEAEKAAPAAKTFIEMLEEGNANNSIPLNPDDPSKDTWSKSRDFSKDDRKPGIINVQRGEFGMGYLGIPTAFRAPIALTPEDLKVSKVDVAFLGASLDMSSGRRGTAFGPSAFRNSGIYIPWGHGFETHSEHTMSHPLEELVLADYGDAPIDFTSNDRSIVPVYKLVKEIAETGTIPAIIGGDHSLMYPNVAAISAVYGRGKVGVIHFDAHIDAEAGGMGHYLTHGSPIRRLIEEGHVPGKNYVQIGLRGWLVGPAMTQYMREKGMKYHFMAEVEKDGWDKVMERVFQEVSDGPDYIYLSIDLDAFDPAFAPGAGTPEPGGLTPRELFPILRGVCRIKQCVGFDIVELNPLVDSNNATSTLANRVAREVLSGIAMRKQGITDPKYLHPELTSHK